MRPIMEFNFFMLPAKGGEKPTSMPLFSFSFSEISLEWFPVSGQRSR